MSYLEFHPVGNLGRKTPVFVVTNGDSAFILGHIKWHTPWRRFCFFPVADTLYDQECLNDISAFIKNEMNKRKV